VVWPLFFATTAFLVYRQSEDPGALVYAGLGSAVMGIWSVIATTASGLLQRERWHGTLELLVASPTPFWATFLPITLAISSIGIYSLATGLLYVRFLFGVPVSVDDWPAFIVAVPPMILSIGLLGFLMGSAFVRFRAAWMVGNLFEFPVWTICGFLIPLALLPSWVEPIAWVLAPTWGMSALSNAALGASAWPDIGMCVLLSIIYAVLGGVLLKAFLRLARERATLGLT